MEVVEKDDRLRLSGRTIRRANGTYHQLLDGYSAQIAKEQPLSFLSPLVPSCAKKCGPRSVGSLAIVQDEEPEALVSLQLMREPRSHSLGTESTHNVQEGGFVVLHKPLV